MSDLSSTIQGVSKPWYQSRTIIGAGVTLLSTAAGLAGYGVPIDVQGQAADLLVTAGGLIGGALTIWGRLRATTSLTR